MITRLKLKPGQKGTKALVAKYGDDFVCVRYKYDEETRERIKTVELFLEKKQLPPPREKRKKIEDGKTVPLKIEYGETRLGKMARALGGKWDPDVKLWYLPYGKVKGTELEKHIILNAAKKRGGK